MKRVQLVSFLFVRSYFRVLVPYVEHRLKIGLEQAIDPASPGVILYTMIF